MLIWFIKKFSLVKFTHVPPDFTARTQQHRRQRRTRAHNMHVVHAWCSHTLCRTHCVIGVYNLHWVKKTYICNTSKSKISYGTTYLTGYCRSHTQCSQHGDFLAFSDLISKKTDQSRKRGEKNMHAAQSNPNARVTLSVGVGLAGLLPEMLLGVAF